MTSNGFNTAKAYNTYDTCKTIVLIIADNSDVNSSHLFTLVFSTLESSLHIDCFVCKYNRVWQVGVLQWSTYFSGPCIKSRCL